MKKENQFFTTRKETEDWLKSLNWKIGDHTIYEDLTVDVDGHVNISYKKLDYIPVKFGIVTGDFDCYYNILQTLKGCPHTVLGDFICSNNKLTSLKGSPHTVSGDFYCNYNQLKNFEGCLKNIGGNFYCRNNPLTDFSYFEFEVKGDIDFTPIAGMDYLDNYKDDGAIMIDFNEFKKLQLLKNLENKLSNNLPINTNITKKMKI